MPWTRTWLCQTFLICKDNTQPHPGTPPPLHYYNTGLRGTEGATREVYPGELVLAGSNLDTLLWVCRGFTLIMVLSGCKEFFFLIWSNILIFSWLTLHWWLWVILRKKLLLRYYHVFSSSIFLYEVLWSETKPKTKSPLKLLFGTDKGGGAGVTLRLL